MAPSLSLSLSFSRPQAELRRQPYLPLDVWWGTRPGLAWSQVGSQQRWHELCRTHPSRGTPHPWGKTKPVQVWHCCANSRTTPILGAGFGPWQPLLYYVDQYARDVRDWAAATESMRSGTVSLSSSHLEAQHVEYSRTCRHGSDSMLWISRMAGTAIIMSQQSISLCASLRHGFLCTKKRER